MTPKYNRICYHQTKPKLCSSSSYKTMCKPNLCGLIPNLLNVSPPRLFKMYLHEVFLKLFTPLQSGGFGAYSATDQEEILASSSGLLNFLFGKDRSGKLNRSAFTSSLAFRCKCTCRHFKEKNDVNDKSSHFQRRLRQAALRPDGRSHPA